MDAGQLNDLLVLAVTLSGLFYTWLKWGRQWFARMRRRAEERRQSRESLSKLVSDWPETHRTITTHMAVVRTYMQDGDRARVKIAADLARTHKELSAGIASNSEKLDGRLDEQDDMLEKIAAELWASARFDVQPRFRCDHEGHNVFCNYSYSKLLQCDEKDLLWFGWKNYILPEDLLAYEHDAAQALREHRRFERNVRFRRRDGTKFLAHVRCEPHPERLDDVAVGKHATWFGSISVIEELA